MISIGKLVDAEQVVRYLVEATTDAQIEYYARAMRRRAAGRAALLNISASRARSPTNN